MKLNIAVLAGDGIGPEIIAQAIKVVDAVCAKKGHEVTYQEALTGAAAIDAVGDPYPDSTHQICLAADAVLFGAIGHPKFDNDPTAKVRPEQRLLRMRKQLGLYRSEERRVGKECRSRGWAYDEREDEASVVMRGV